MTRPSLLATIAFVFSAQCASAAGEPGLSFEHDDWNLACDNTRTCMAAGYQSDADEASVSVLLTRNAGPGQAVKGQLQIGQDDDDLMKTLPKTFALAMTIDGKSQGGVMVTRETMQGDLSNAQVAALLASLAHGSDIKWSIGKNTWHLSDKGATAVLLKMDDFQGRIGTRGALIRKGALGEDKVLPALPAPVVVAAPVLDGQTNDKFLSESAAKKLRGFLIATVKDDTCSDPPDEGPQAPQVSIARLNDRKLLASVLCWQAAYNEGYGDWVINKSEPYDPVLVTTSGTDYAKGEIISGQKGRGIGDCWSIDTWTWDGSRFVRTGSSTHGLCKGFTGGAWTMPTVVSQVRHP